MLRWATHSLVLAQKNAKLKLRSKLTTLLEILLPIIVVSLLIPFFWMLVGIQNAGQKEANYARENLPPISATSFDDRKGKLLYAPFGIADVDCLITKLKELAPKREFQGFATEEALLSYF